MKISAGIAGILLGIFSLTYVGLFGGMIGTGAGWLGSLGPHGNSTITNWAGMVSTLSWLSPLLAIVGGIITFSIPRFGGGILAVSAFLHWYLLGFGTIGNLFVLPLGAAALLAFFAAPSTSTSTPLGATTATSGQSDSVSNVTVDSFDRAKWNALLQYDKDIALMAEKLQPLGQKWLDEFASSYLALNDKTYLPEIERKIVAAAKAEEEQNERQRIYAEVQQRAFLQEREHRAQARKKKLELWRDRVWGNSKRKLLTVTCGVVVIGLMVLAFWLTSGSQAPITNSNGQNVGLPAANSVQIQSLEIPRLEGTINDYAQMISPATKVRLEGELKSFEQTDSTQMVLLTVPSLQGKNIEEFGIKVAEVWKIGQKNKDNGIIVVVAKRERKIRINVGRGLEDRLPDLLAGRIIDLVITPRFKRGDFDGGFEAGVAALIDATRGRFSTFPPRQQQSQ